ncbi:MAG: SGNH/GDSL hydrolase family protein [Oscillospiraceae bacterium]|nr:SGNH/GDSL hydrolase family protein [Oscillospiraceae bacterium]
MSTQIRKKRKKNTAGNNISGAIAAALVAIASMLLVICTVLIVVEPIQLPTQFILEQLFPADPVKPNNSDTKSDLPDDTAASQSTLLTQTLPADNAYMDSICFVGDSITYGLGAYGHTDKNSTFGFVGLHQETALTKQYVNLGGSRLLTMAEAVGKLKPKRIVLLIGINAVSWMDESTFFSLYQQLIDDLKEASPNSVLIIESILPVTTYYENYVDPRCDNKKIDDYNQKLLDLADKNDCYFLNTAEVFKATDGTADVTLMNGDGLHVNNKGYERMLDYIRSHAVG